MLKPILTVLVSSLLTATAWSADTALSSVDKQDQEFARQAAIAGMVEIQTSELALKRGLTGDDKQFADMMIDDHKKADKELKAIAEKKGITLPTTLDEKSHEKVDKLGKANDKEFAERYFECQIDAHKKAVDLFEDEADKGKDPDLKAFAIATLPTLKTHLDHAKKMEDKH
jgi:putative membrane protein